MQESWDDCLPPARVLVPSDEWRACGRMSCSFVQDKDKLPAPLKNMDFRPGFEAGYREVEASDNTDRIIQQTVGLTSTPSGTPG